MSDDLGGLFLVGFEGTEFSQDLALFLGDLAPAGVVLFGRNVVDPYQVARLNHDLQTFAAGRFGRGMFIGVDHEGGRVQRIREPYTVAPPARRIALAPDPDVHVRRYAQIAARELRLAGFNLNFVPVLDVLSSPDSAPDTVIGDRSFGHDPEVVARLGCAVIEEMRASRVIPCAKHFPGHGAAEVDSHLSLPVDARPRDVIEARDLVPFRGAITAGVEMMMTAHVTHVALDPHRPATFSYGTLSELLRKDMGYKGVVITDDLNMGAVSTNHTIADAAALAFEAGADLLLLCNTPYAAFDARAALRQRLADAPGLGHRVEESLARIDALRKSYADFMIPSDTAVVREYLAAKDRGADPYKEVS